MEKYIDKFKENDCADMESIPHFDDDDLKDIGLKKILRKKFLAKCAMMKQEIDEFRNKYQIPSILNQRLAKYGVVTINILCGEVKDKKDLQLKYQITNERQCNLLWELIQQKENLNDIEGI
eukprot:100248_1